MAKAIPGCGDGETTNAVVRFEKSIGALHAFEGVGVGDAMVDLSRLADFGRAPQEVVGVAQLAGVGSGGVVLRTLGDGDVLQALVILEVESGSAGQTDVHLIRLVSFAIVDLSGVAGYPKQEILVVAG